MLTELKQLFGVDSKVCTLCKKNKALSLFHKQTSNINGKQRQAACKECLKMTRKYDIKKEQLYYQNNLDMILANRLKRSYWPNLDRWEGLAKYRTLLKIQNNCCSICNKPEKIRPKNSKKYRSLSIDVNRKTGEIKGVLCHNCSLAIGFLGNNPAIFIQAAEYLKKGEE